MLKDFLIYLIFLFFKSIIPFFPIGLNSATARIIGRIYYLTDRSRRRIIRANISVVYGRSLNWRQKEELAKKSCEYLAMSIFDILIFDKIITRYNYLKFFDIRGLSYLFDSIKRGKGTIVVMGHFGNFFLVRYACYLNIPPRATIIRKLDNPYIERFVTKALKEHGVTGIRPKGALKRMHQLLLNNSVVVTLADQKAGGNQKRRHGFAVDLFGIPSQTHITAPLLARRTGAAVLPVFVIRTEPGRYRIEVNKPLKFIHTDYEEDDLRKNTRKINQLFEEYIKKYPEEWFWLHRRWKNIAGLKDLYKTSNPLSLVEDFRKNIKSTAAS